ncbi:hypothetical protein PRO82_001462 [Candidatus Protochlamydia amoebophila]|nr:hypothetical protein [Candidatus Protochlamydia amoebophila]
MHMFLLKFQVGFNKTVCKEECKLLTLTVDTPKSESL